MRSHFEQWFPATHPLRLLAADVASLGLGPATTSGVWTAKPPPWNLLSNGMAAGWRPAAATSLAGWVGAKGGSLSDQGFSGQRWGLSLLFDPFVDATLWAYGGGHAAGSSPRAFSGARVLVLTDYSPIKDVLSDATRMHPVDYGEREVLELLLAEKNLKTTGYNIVKWITQRDAIASVGKSLEQDSEYVQKQLALHRVLIWNFFPFQRGGNKCEGKEGLPDMQNSQWLQLCRCYLVRFLQAVSASEVIWAANQNVPSYWLSSLNLPFRKESHPRNWGNLSPMPVL